MAILFRKVVRPSDPTQKDSAKKAYPAIVYKYGYPVRLGEMAKEISSNSGVSEGTSISVLKDFRTLLRKILLGGRAVNIEGLGYFFLSAQSKGTENPAEFTPNDITALRICFRANKDIRLTAGSGATRTDGLHLKDVDKLNKDTVQEEVPGGNEPGGEGGNGGGEAPDPLG